MERNINYSARVNVVGVARLPGTGNSYPTNLNNTVYAQNYDGSIEDFVTKEFSSVVNQFYYNGSLYFDFTVPVNIECNKYTVTSASFRAMIASYEYRDGSMTNHFCYPTEYQFLLNGEPIGKTFPVEPGQYGYGYATDYTYSGSVKDGLVTSYGFRAIYSGSVNLSWQNNTISPCYMTTRVTDTTVWTFETPATNGDVIIAINENFTRLEATITDGVDTIVNASNANTDRTITQIQTSAGQILAAVSSTPAQNQTAQTQKDEMHQATTQIQDNVQAIEDKTNRPDPEKTAQDIDPLGRLDPSDPARVSMYDGLGAILKTDFFLTVLLMVFGMAFCAYVLFGKRG